jgi:hypothetical protein
MLGPELFALASDGRAAFAPVVMKIAAAKPGCLHFQDDFIVAGNRIVEAHQLELAMPAENDATHWNSFL